MIGGGGKRWPVLLSFLSPLTPLAAVLLLAAFGLLASLLSVARSAVEGATSAICW